MVVTEQVDALQSMAVNPVQYLVSPRLFAGITMMPILTLLFSLVGILGAYLVVVIGMGLDAGVFKRRILDVLVPWDIWSGLIKASVFGAVISTIGCHTGFSATGGARGGWKFGTSWNGDSSSTTAVSRLPRITVRTRKRLT